MTNEKHFEDLIKNGIFSSYAMILEKSVDDRIKQEILYGVWFMLSNENLNKEKNSEILEKFLNHNLLKIIVKTSRSSSKLLKTSSKILEACAATEEGSRVLESI
jgi:hypothetical protein